ncbi:MAG: AAA family ATPase, partial [Trueperaceae bacterium]
MRLTQLTLAGFKSFGNRTTVEFSPGVTAVVGPNGSGKSNLIDALKWVTGGGRAREFRAEAKTDLIFHGADGKRGLGYAEVEVELSDGKRTLKVRRDLDREGASRLRLDGRAARFLDVDEALAGSGLGTAGVAVIGQGEVAGVLMADPATLLGYVAEAAGVARLAGRREQTQARLDASRLHLARLEDVLFELRERIELLRHEAEAAERHAALSREALILRVTAGHARVAALEGEVAALRREAAASEQEVLELRERAAAARAANDALRRERTTVEAAYRDVLAAAASAQGALDVARAEVRRAEDRAAALRATQDAAWTEVARLEADPEPEAPIVDRSAAADAAAAARSEADGARSAFETAERAHGDAVAALDRVRAARTTAEQAWAGYRARREALQHEFDEVERERVALERGAAATEAEDLEALRDRAEGARKAVQAAGRSVDGARADLERDHAAHAAAHAEAGARARAGERLRAAFEARRGYAQGPRVALTSGIAGVRGSVADLFRVAPGREAAIAGALGRRAEYVVVDTAETAEAVLAAVRSASGWATVLPLDLLRPPRGGDASTWAHEPGVLGAAADAVDVDPADRPVVAQLLAHTYLVRDLAAATALARRHRDRPRLVTLDGDVVEASGAMSGGRRTGGATVLGQARDLEDAEEAARAAAEAEGAARTRLDGARARLHEA